MKKVELVRQVELAECGLACMVMILNAHGYQTTLADLRATHSVSTRGMSVDDIVTLSESVGLIGRALKLEVSETEQLVTPCILHWGMDHFVVLDQVQGGHYKIIDPQDGELDLDTAGFAKKFTGIAIEFQKSASFVPLPKRPTPSLWKALRAIQGLKKTLISIVAAAVVLEVLTLAMPQFMRITIDSVIPNSDNNLLGIVTAGYFIAVMAQALLTAGRSRVLVFLNTKVNLVWSTSIFSHLMKLPQEYFQKRVTGDIMSRFSAINSIQQAITGQLLAALLDGVMAITVLIFLTYFNAQLTAIVVLVTGIYVASRYLYLARLQSLNYSALIFQAKLQTLFLDAVRGVETLRNSNRGPVVSGKYFNLAVDYADASSKMQLMGQNYNALSIGLSGLQRVVVLAAAAYLTIKKEFTAGAVVAFMSYADIFLGKASAFIDSVIQLRLVRMQADRLADIVFTEPEKNRVSGYLGDLSDAALEIDRLAFRYSASDPWLFNGASLSIRLGESCVFVGPSGGGKSTLLRLLMGSLDPTSGSISVGGLDLAKIGKERYRKAMSCCLQDDTLFEGTVMDNITFFDPSPDLAWAMECAKRAVIHSEISQMPLGYRTLVGDMGSAVSGGQKQRLILARALYRRPKILIMDEATSHLDIPLEKQLLDNLREIGCTRISAAHRQEAIATADRVFLVLNGEVRELSRKKEIDSSDA